MMDDLNDGRINRRKFLGAGGAGLLAASLPGIMCKPAVKPKDSGEVNTTAAPGGGFQPDGWAAMIAASMKFRKLDAHNHVFDDGATTVESCRRLGITRAACSIPFGKTVQSIRDYNDQIIKAMKKYPNCIMGQCYINPLFAKESLEEIDRCVDQGMVMLGELYDAVKINDPRYYPIVERCIRHKIPMMLHGVTTLGNWRAGYLPTNPPNSSVPEDFVEIGKRYPEAMIICGHIGGGGNWEYVCRVLKDAPTVFLDTSGSVSDEGMIDMAVQYIGVNRLLFATDVNYETGVGKIMWANISDEDRKKIFFDNFNNLLRPGGNHVD